VTEQGRDKIFFKDLASMLVEECVDTQHVHSLREDLSTRAERRFAASTRRYQIAGLLMFLGATSEKRPIFAQVRECVEGIEFHGKSENEAQQLRAELAVTTKSLFSLLAPQAGEGQFTWARAWYQDIGMDEANPAVLAHLAMQWLDFCSVVQRILERFEPEDESVSSVPACGSTAEIHGTAGAGSDAKELACMRLVSEMRLEALHRELEEHARRPPRSGPWKALHPFAYRREQRKFQKDQRWLEQRIATIRGEAPPRSPSKKTLYALWDSCDLTGVAIGLDAGATLIGKWIAVLYGDDTARRINVLYRAHQVAAEQAEQETAGAEVGDMWDFAPPIETLLYQLSEELPEYDQDA
jgi:hypothetical protein